ncbi:MAG: DNA primase [Thiohalomonadales bacterium]
MAGNIPREFIDELLSRTDILDVVQRRLPLKKQGKDYSACCPFHTEKTPSFTVSQNKQFFYCFGCGASGSALSFIMQFDNIGFLDAVEDLAASAGLEIPRDKQDQQYQDKQHLYAVMLKAAAVYTAQLRQSDDATKAIAYLKQRGLSGEISKTYEVGLATTHWDDLHRQLSSDGISTAHMLEAGLVVAKKSTGYYDRFRDRIIFPIRDNRGRVIAFGGRTLGDDKAKYLNSPETPIFHKSNALYGLFEARKANRNLEKIIVVEGYMDCLALAQHGITNCVATLGTATNEQHLKQLFQHCAHIIFCFDGDKAGHQAAWRALKNSLGLLRDGRQLQFMFLPDGEDPDSYIRNNDAERFLQNVATATPFSSYFFSKLSENINLDTIDGRSVLANRAKPLLKEIPPGVFQQLMQQQLNTITGYKSQSSSTITDSVYTQHQTRKNPSFQMSPVRHAIRMLLEYPILGLEVDTNDILKIDLPGIPLLCEIITMVQQQPEISCGALLERWRESDNGKHLNKLACVALTLDKEGVEREFVDTITHLMKTRLDQQIQTLLDKSQHEHLSVDEERELAALYRSR